ncbi:MAG TPA: M56 family metallopeptidase, partial [Chitinophagaceae bacterium]|nr:M56 family metallopeptidase [Chitinophagaceae bacterium]
MPAILYYIIKLSIALCVVYLFYQLVLRKLTFYNWNRWYLLVYSILAFFIPFINISPVINNSELDSSTLINWIPVLEGKAMETTTVVAEQGPDGWKLVILFIAAGSLVLAGRLLLQFFSFSLLLQRAELIEKGTLNLYHVDDKIIPFSFGNSIFINRNQHSAVELQEIIAHEFVHVRQRHTMDIIWGEILFMLNWYNPFAWLIRKAIRQNLEFIADNQVIRSGMDKKQYQYLLLKVIGNNHFSIAQHFNFSSLKKRIAMMNKLRSAKHNLARFLFILPIVAIMLFAFRNEYKKTNRSEQTINKTETRDTLSDNLPADYKAFFIKNPEIKDVYWNRDPYRITIKLNNGEKETYNLGRNEEVQVAEDKYGKLPAGPPAPPPSLSNDTTPVVGVTAPPIPAKTKLPENVQRISVKNDEATV